MPRRILVVDDELFMHRMLQALVEKAGYEFRSAASGHEALAAVRSDPPHLIVLDVMMAGLDGLATLNRLKQDETTRHIPVIILTAKAHRLTRQEAEQSGAAVVFTKPFSPTQLLLEIGRLLDQPGT